MKNKINRKNKELITVSNLAELQTMVGAVGYQYQVLDIDRMYIWDAETSSFKDVGSSSVADNSITNAQISPTAQIDASKIANGSVSNAEFQALSTLAQDLTDAKQSSNNTIDGTFAPSNTAIVTGDTEKVAFQKAQGQINAISTAVTNGLALKENLSNKDASNGYVGKTLHKINFSNNVGTQTSFLQNNNTALRMYTFQDRDGTVADDTDLATKVGKTGNETIAGIKTFSSSPLVPTATAGDSSTKASNTEYVQGELANRVKAPTSYTAGNLVKYNSTTNELEDAGGTLGSKIDKPASATANNVAIFDVNKNVIDSGFNKSVLGIIDGEVNTFADLPDPTTKDGEIWLVKTTTGTIFINRKNAALYVSNGTAWNVMMPINIDGYQVLISSPTANRVVIVDANGQVQQSSQLIDDILSKAIAGQISSLTEKTTLASNDAFLIEDSASSNAKKYLKYSTILTQIADTTKTTVTKYVNDLTGSDTNDGNTEFTAYKTIEKAWTDITPSGQVKVLGAATYNVNHTFANTKTSIKTILEGGTKITGTIGFVAGNTSMQFIGGKVQATINDASSGTQYWGGVDVSGSTFNFSGGGYKQITNSSSTPAAINLSGSTAGTLEINNIIGGIIPITSNALWMTMYRNSIVSKLGTTGTFVDANNIYANAVVTSQGVLDNLPADGYYILNFTNPVIAGITVGKGDVIYKTGSTRLRVYEFANAPASFAVVNPTNTANRDTYIKSADGWLSLETFNYIGLSGYDNASSPSTPAADMVRLYYKRETNRLAYKGDDGTELSLPIQGDSIYAAEGIVVGKSGSTVSSFRIIGLYNDNFPSDGKFHMGIKNISGTDKVMVRLPNGTSEEEFHNPTIKTGTLATVSGGTISGRNNNIPATDDSLAQFQNKVRTALFPFTISGGGSGIIDYNNSQFLEEGVYLISGFSSASNPFDGILALSPIRLETTRINSTVLYQRITARDSDGFAGSFERTINNGSFDEWVDLTLRMTSYETRVGYCKVRGKALYQRSFLTNFPASGSTTTLISNASLVDLRYAVINRDVNSGETQPLNTVMTAIAPFGYGAVYGDRFIDTAGGSIRMYNPGISNFNGNTISMQIIYTKV